jgi:hypothetical protein
MGQAFMASLTGYLHARRSAEATKVKSYKVWENADSSPTKV